MQKQTVQTASREMAKNLALLDLALSVALLFSFARTAAAQNLAVLPALIPMAQRNPAIDFALQDDAGKTATLQNYRGQVVLLDFWATWCTGCKEEIPWFSEFQKTYGGRGFAAIGVSLDQAYHAPGAPQGWDAVRPFLAQMHSSYRMLLADEATARRYAFHGLPDTFLIDRHGRIAAAYIERLVDKNDVEAKIKALLSER